MSVLAQGKVINAVLSEWVISVQAWFSLTDGASLPRSSHQQQMMTAWTRYSILCAQECVPSNSDVISMILRPRQKRIGLRRPSSSFDCSSDLSLSESYFGRYSGVCVRHMFFSSLAED